MVMGTGMGDHVQVEIIVHPHGMQKTEINKNQTVNTIVNLPLTYNIKKIICIKKTSVFS